jgi:hypothetical protein
LRRQASQRHPRSIEAVTAAVSARGISPRNTSCASLIANIVNAVRQ